MKSSELISPRAKRSARIFLASASGERLLAANDGDPKVTVPNQEEQQRAQHEQHQQEKTSELLKKVRRAALRPLAKAVEASSAPTGGP